MLFKKEVDEAQKTDHLKKYDLSVETNRRLKEQAKTLGMSVSEYKAICIKRATL